MALTWNSPPQLAPNQTVHHTAKVKPVVAADGTLRLNINQLFPGSLRLGQFIVEVSGPDGRGASTVFLVDTVGRLISPASTTGLPGGSARPGRQAGSGRRR